jgi:hypothetical protein
VGNLQSYVRWRGDLTFAERPFTLVDNLVLAALAYLDLEGLVPTAPGQDVTVAAAASARTEREAADGPGVVDRRLTVVPASLLSDLAGSARFADARLSAYVDQADDDQETQFAAVTVHLPDGTDYVAFRGTDNTILGWREDFTMSFRTVPAQKLAQQYLSAHLARSSADVRVGGHSKGGNLALYAAMTATAGAGSRLVHVYNNDGPGLSSDVADEDALARLDGKITTLVPEMAVIGMIFQPEEADRTVVASTGKGLLQHDLMTWQVGPRDVVRLPHLAPRAALINRGIASWIAEATTDDRQSFTDALFGALSAGGATLITDVGRADYGSFEAVLLSLARTRRTTRRPTRLAIRSAARTVAMVDVRPLLRQREAVQAAAFIALGVFLVTAPSNGLPVLAAFTVFVLASLLTYRLGRFFRQFRTQMRLSVASAVVGTVALAAVVGVASQVELLAAPVNFLLAVCFLVHAWQSAQLGLQRRRGPRPRRGRSAFLLASSGASALIGVVILSTVAHVPAFAMQQAGHYCLVVGLLEAFLLLQERTAVAATRARALDQWSA